MNAKTLREMISDFLDREVLVKSEEDRTGRDNVLLQTGQAFCEVLVRHEKAQGPKRYETEYAKLSHGFTALASMEPEGD